MILIPESALIRQGQLTGIYTGNGNVAILRWLRTENFGNQIEVLSGLSADERYIASAEENCLTERRLVFSKVQSVVILTA
jgi:hypothetical protein